MKQCSECRGRFGLIRSRYWASQFCSKKCREVFLQRLADERTRINKWLRFLAQPP
jgi:endogenous inhibitor of DNA gyrase (YacG/DUF329 family)